MKSISHYSNAAVFFIIVMFSILFMNAISAFMLITLAEKKEASPVNESYIFEGFELCLS